MLATPSVRSRKAGICRDAVEGNDRGGPAPPVAPGKPSSAGDHILNHNGAGVSCLLPIYHTICGTKFSTAQYVQLVRRFVTNESPLCSSRPMSLWLKQIIIRK